VSTVDDDVKAIKKLGEEFFAAVNAADLDRRMATMAPDVIIMPGTCQEYCVWAMS